MSLVGLLITLLVLGAMAVFVLRLTTSKPLTPAARNAPTAAAQAVCNEAVAALNQAVAAYRQLNGSPPPPGRAWAVTSADGGPWIQSWPGVAHAFSITWTGHDLKVSTPHGASCSDA